MARYQTSPDFVRADSAVRQAQHGVDDATSRLIGYVNDPAQLCGASDELVAAVLTSEVSSGVGHTTQICVLPGFQGHGIGRMLMQTSAEALRSMKFRELTLTVTSDNRTAVQLYEKLGFQTIKSFTAGVWPR